MEVIKRDGRKENVSFDKITTRISHLTYGLNNKYVNPTKIAQETINGLYDGISTVQLDQLSADICASKIQQHSDFGKLASRILVSNLHKSTEKDYFEVVRNLFHHSIVSEAFFSFVFKYSKQLQEMLDYNRDYNFDFFGFKTLERSYLHAIKIGNEKKVIERPQHLWMRVAIQIHGLRKIDQIDQIDELESFKVLQKVKTTYDYMSLGFFTHATPTLFNAGSNRPQLSSCFLASMDDNIENIFKTIGDLGQISKWSGGIGVHLSSIRAKGSLIKGTNGHSDGIIPLCKVLEATARYINQSGKRLGSIAVYLEPWHADIQDFVDLRKNTGDENLRARDLFLALWVPDLFMKRVQNDEMWSLMSSDVCPGLNDSYGEEFEKLYTQYESEGKFIKQIRATELWRQILENQIETGMPYISYKDHVNQKSNQKNLGVIKSSNLCNEINEFSDKDQTAVCNLASICLPSYVEEGIFNFEKLHEITKVITKNLNKVIDKNFYPIEKARVSNLKHRPIGIGVQGLADVFIKLRFPFESEDAKQLNKDIFETIYHAAIEASMELSKKRFHIINDIKNINNKILDENINNYVNEFEKDIKNPKYIGAYSSFEGSPISQGLFQFDLWNAEPSTRYDWDKLRTDIINYGVRNSLLLSPMPTASTSQIMGFNESFEPFTNNIFQRKTLSGEFIIINKYLINDLISKGLWSKELKDTIILHEGSVQNISEIDDELKAIYKTAWEIKQRNIIDMSADRGQYICQTQSLNIFMEEPDFQKLSSMHFYGHSKGLKTGSYYLRTRPKAKTQQFTIDPDFAKKKRRCVEDNGDTCVLCSS